METMPKLSVIIPTLNRKDFIKNTLFSIRDNKDYSNFEIIIVDQSDSYNRSLLEKDIKELLPELKLKYFQVEFKSLPKARNYGITMSTGEIILFLDDDVLIPPGLFLDHVNSYYLSEEFGGVAGKLIEQPDLWTNSKRVGSCVSFTGRYFRNFKIDESGYVKAAVGANMSFKKTIIDKVGFFDERYIGTSELEETDYCYRVRKLGFGIFYNHKAALKHLISKDGGCRANFRDRQYYKMHNLGLFFSKHKSVCLFIIFIIFQVFTIIKRVMRNPEKKRLSACLFILKGLLRGYLTTSKRKIK